MIWFFKKKGEDEGKGEGTKTMIMSEGSLKKDWDNKYDEKWDKICQRLKN